VTTKYRPSTEGCTEWSCMYHGGENRFKSGHDKSCPIWSYDGFVIEAFDPEYTGPVCECSHDE